MKNKEKRPSKKNSKKENKKFPYKSKRKFTNPKDAFNYLRNEAKEGEGIILDEPATAIHPRRILLFKKLDKTKVNKLIHKGETNKSLAKE